MNVKEAVLKIKTAGYNVVLASNDAKLTAARNAKARKHSSYRPKNEEIIRQNFHKPIWNVEGTLYTERELIKFAKTIRKIGNKNLKDFSKRTRAAERDTIKTEEFDKIPQKGPMKTEDPWSWD